MWSPAVSHSPNSCQLAGCSNYWVTGLHYMMQTKHGKKCDRHNVPAKSMIHNWVCSIWIALHNMTDLINVKMYSKCGLCMADTSSRYQLECSLTSTSTSLVLLSLALIDISCQSFNHNMNYFWRHRLSLSNLIIFPSALYFQFLSSIYILIVRSLLLQTLIYANS